MHRILPRLAIAGAILALISSSWATGQMTKPKPAEQLAKFDAMIGNWTGSGSMQMSPDAPKMKWTAQSTGKRILEGHFIQVDTIVDMGMAKSAFRQVYGWNRYKERYEQFQIGNDGSGGVVKVMFTEDGRLVSSHMRRMMGKVMHESWVTTLEKDKHTFKGFQSIEGGTPTLSVEGSMTRGGEGFQLGGGEPSPTPPSKQLAPLKKLIGNWTYSGWAKMDPAQDRMQVSGTEAIKPILGGHAIMAEVVGGEFYLGNNYMYWDATEKTLKAVGMNNMGEMVSMPVECTANTFKMNYAGPAYGKTVCTQHVTTFSDDGNSMTSVSTAVDNGKAVTTFEMKITRSKP